MKEKITYTCEICHTEYSNKADCERCENGHKTPDKIGDCLFAEPYTLNNNGTPDRIELKFGRRSFWYIREQKR